MLNKVLELFIDDNKALKFGVSCKGIGVCGP